MGKALKGGTLQEWSQPLMQSLFDLSVDEVGDKDDPPLIIEKAHAVGEAPEAWVNVLRGYKPGGRPQYVRYLLTEASWGSDFTPATATSTYWWALLTAGRVYDRALELLWWNLYAGSRIGIWWFLKRCTQIAVYTVVAVGGLVLVVAALALLLVLLILAQIPGPPRLWLGQLVTLFADFLGDPQVWKRKPLQATAMRQRVSDTLLRWDHASGVDVTVVAHSQGAAVAGQLLFQSKDRARATNFVSVGSGLSILGYAEWGGSTDDPVQDWLNNAPRTRWINMWGKFDFVPAGPIGTKTTGDDPVFKELFDPKRPDEAGFGPEEHPVYNRSALIKDHIVYSKNRIEVIDPLARLIFLPVPAEGTVQFGPPPDDKRLRPHRVMVKSLGVTRLLAAISAGLCAPEVLSWLGSNQWARAAVQCGTVDGGQDPWWSSWLCSEARYDWTFPPSPDWWVLGLVSLALAGALIRVLNGLVWEFLHGMLERRRKSPCRKIDEGAHKLSSFLRRLIGLRARKNLDQRVGDPTRYPWLKVFTYLAIAFILAVAVPIAVARPEGLWLIVYAVSAGLWILCFTDTGMRPLRARRPTDARTVPPRAAPTEAGRVR